MNREEMAKAASDEELIQMWKNAHTTGCLCGGHKKAARNEYFQSIYEAELRRRNIEIPKNSDGGIFNGNGAF